MATFYLISTSGEPSVNRIDLQALTLEGPTRNNLVLDPLAELHLDNQLFKPYNLLFIFNIIVNTIMQ